MDVLQIERLEAYYGDMQALFGVSLNLRAGETFALVGANGAGKSTLMRSLVGLVKDRRGHIRLGGGRSDQHRPRGDCSGRHRVGPRRADAVFIPHRRGKPADGCDERAARALGSERGL